MNSFFKKTGTRLIREYNKMLWIEPWGDNSLRIRATKMNEMPLQDWALIPQQDPCSEILIEGDIASIRNGNICAKVSAGGKITFYNQKNEVLLEEYVRNRNDMQGFCSALDLEAREFKPIIGGDYSLTMRFESKPDEKIFGMGQYQQPYLDMKNCTLELAHRNSQASVPFALSNLGYGLLWNNPAIGHVNFNKNLTQWQSISTKALDYWIVAGDHPAEIVETYADVQVKYR